MSKDLSQLREDYTGENLRRKDLSQDPIEQFQTWFSQAQDLEVVEPNAMSLATVDEKGQPWQRLR